MTGYSRKLLVEVLVYHQPTSTSGCICGWRVLGASHPEHVADVYEMEFQHQGGGSSMTEEARFVLLHVHRVEVGPDLFLLQLEDGGFAFEHRCKIVDGFQLVVSPRLDKHQVMVPLDPDLEADLWHVRCSVRPSILCPDCGIHGFITDGKWVPA